jgi:pullulanase/glycogen debranching enzyme
MKSKPVSAAALLALLVSAGAHAAIGPDACDSKSYQAVLSPSAAHFDARAIWLDRRLLAFPDAPADGVFKLYHSATGAIAAPVGGKVAGSMGALTLGLFTGSVPAPLAERFKWVGAGPVLQVMDDDVAKMGELHRGQLVLVQEDAQGIVRAATRVQVAGALDDLYAAAGNLDKLGVDIAGDAAHKRTSFTVWAPTAQQAAVCVYNGTGGSAHAVYQMRFDPATGAWSAALAGDLSGKYYKYAVDVPVDGAAAAGSNTGGIVRNLVTDPYSISLNTDSKRSYIARLDAPRLKPAGWDAAPAPQTVRNPTDMVVYELHVRDFSINDASVPQGLRGKYAAFTRTESNGMRHLAALAKSGLTDIHLLPVYDIGSVPEVGCAVPKPSGAPDSEAQQALVKKTAETDCFNWGYDPYHYNAPEGSYATDPSDGARRVVEFREMVDSLHKLGLRVGMDVVFNHTFSAGQVEKSVLDRVVPGYYHRLNAAGGIERSTCCDNTATENRMMGKLMIDSVALWATQYKIDSFRFDLMGHQPRAVMEQLQQTVNAAAGHPVQLLGEGWNFGEVADGARFVQASQLSLNGSGIGTFNDRTRDAVRGGSAGDAGEALFARQGWINGLVVDPNGHAGKHDEAELLRAADMVRAGLAGSIRSYPLQTFDDKVVPLASIDYGGQPAGYASEPSEVVNYVENHDNQTLYDIDVFKLPASTSSQDRARVQVLGMAVDAFAQGIAYFHAGIDVLRSKSLDRNSFNSGDWFNRLDWTYRDNYFGTGLPPAEDNGKDYALLKPLLGNHAFKPAPNDIAFARDAFRDLLAIRASSSLFRLPTAAEIRRRLRFFNTGSNQNPTVVAAHLDGEGYSGAAFKGISYFINVDKVGHTVTDEQAAGKAMRLHPVFLAPGAADKRATQASFDPATGSFNIPPRTAVVFVED